MFQVDKFITDLRKHMNETHEVIAKNQYKRDSVEYKILSVKADVFNRIIYSAEVARGNKL